MAAKNRLPVLLFACLLSGCAQVPPGENDMLHAVGVTINGAHYRVQEGTAIKYRDPKTGRMIPLEVNDPQ